MKHSNKITLILLVFVLTLTLTAGLAEESGGKEIILPELGIAFTLPEGFDDINIHDTDPYVSVDTVKGYDFCIFPGETKNPENPILIKKVKDKSNRFVWEEKMYGNHKFLMFTHETHSGHWGAVIMFENRYGFEFYLTFPESIDDPFFLAEEILSSVRFSNNDG